jgi:hypothetical protein
MNWTKTIGLATGTLGLSALLFLVGGCREEAKEQPKNTGATTQSPKSPDPAEAEIQEERAKLNPEEHKLVDAQEWCVITGERLGSMGRPIKLALAQPVFICCAHCQKDAMANPERTLAKAQELKDKKRLKMSSK